MYTQACTQWQKFYDSPYIQCLPFFWKTLDFKILFSQIIYFKDISEKKFTWVDDCWMEL